MADKKVRIALVGGGNVAQVAHLPAYKSHPDVELAALVEDDPIKRRWLGEHYGFKDTYDDLTKMLENKDVDAVDICTPNYLHAPMTIAALRAGKHVLCEKPLARNAVEAKKMVEAAKASKKILMVAMNNRFRRDVEVLQKFIKNGELGHVQIVKAGWRRMAQDWRDRNWFTDQEKSGGGALLDLGTPKMDLAIWIAGLKKPTRVTCNAFGRSTQQGVEDSACALVNFAGGSCLILEVTWNLHEPADQTYFEVYGTKGAATLQPLTVHKAMHGQLVNVTPALDRSRNFYKESYRREIHHFVECIQKKRSPLTTGAEALKVLKILDAMYESASSGREVCFA